MQLAAVQRILGVLLMLFSLTMVPPMAIGLWSQDGTGTHFLAALALILVMGLAFWLPAQRSSADLRIRDGFLVVVLFWTVLGLTGSLPLMLSESPRMSWTDAVFESISGLTTTGATVIVGIDELPASIRLDGKERV